MIFYKSREALATIILATCIAGAASAKVESINYRNIEIPDHSGKIMTVRGLVSPNAIRQTLMHEHLFIKFFIPLDQPKRWKKYGIQLPTQKEALEIWSEPFTERNRSRLLQHRFFNKDAHTLDNVEDMLDEALAYKNLGGNTIVDLTSIGLGREPEKLLILAESSDMNIIMGTGFYKTMFHPDDMDQRSLDDLTLQIIQDIVLGVKGVEIRAGIIGEIPAANLATTPKESNEIRVLRAAARASRLTGAAISIHNEWNLNNFHLTLDILESEGADLSRVIMGHMMSAASSDFSLLESLLRRGVYLQFDTLGFPWMVQEKGFDSRPITDVIVDLIKRGYSDQILLSHDVHSKYQLVKYGGYGMTFINNAFIPYLLQKGIQQSNIERIVVDNPRRILTFTEPKKSGIHW